MDDRTYVRDTPMTRFLLERNDTLEAEFERILTVVRRDSRITSGKDELDVISKFVAISDEDYSVSIRVIVEKKERKNQ